MESSIHEVSVKLDVSKFSRLASSLSYHPIKLHKILTGLAVDKAQDMAAFEEIVERGSQMLTKSAILAAWAVGRVELENDVLSASETKNLLELVNDVMSALNAWHGCYVRSRMASSIFDALPDLEMLNDFSHLYRLASDIHEYAIQTRQRSIEGRFGPR